MNKCNDKSFPSTLTTASLEHDRNTSTETLILQLRSRSGHAIHLTVRISQDLTHSTVDLNRLCRVVNLGEGVDTSATIHFFDSYDGEPTRVESLGGMAI